MLVLNTGITHHDKDKSTHGYTLYSRTQTKDVYLIDMDGNVVKQWETGGGSTHFVELMPNGNLWVCERAADAPNVLAGPGGRMCEYDWDGNLVWEHEDLLQHHDARRLENGGAAYIAWDHLDDGVAKRIKGGVPGSERDGGMLNEVIREVDAGGNLVWEWSNTELDFDKYPLHRNATRAIYGHCNTLDVLPDGNYLLSFKVLNLLLILERGTGRLLWEYQDDSLGGQHDVQMLENGNILVFANGAYATDIHFSTVREIDPDTNETVWTYKAKRNAVSFFSPHISGCQRLSGGNTLICEGGKGAIFEVTPDCDVVWEYVSPYWGPRPVFGEINFMFRARRYAADSPQIRNRV